MSGGACIFTFLQSFLFPHLQAVTRICPKVPSSRINDGSNNFLGIRKKSAVERRLVLKKEACHRIEN